MQSLGPVLVRVGFGLGPGLGWDFVLCGFWSGRVGLDRVRLIVVDFVNPIRNKIFRFLSVSTQKAQSLCEFWLGSFHNFNF